MIKRTEALVLYRKLFLARQCEEVIRVLYPANDMKTPVHLGIGGEAIPIGVCHCLPTGSKHFGTYRNHTLFLTLSEDTDGFFAELYGKVTGVGKGKAGSMHLTSPEHGLVATSAVVATTIPVAVGAAFAAKYKGSKEMAAVFFGDGAMEEGVFWESMNFASLHRLPILFVCEDNDLAIHTLISERRAYRSAVDIAQAFDCCSASADGYHVVDVIRETRKVLAVMKKTKKPGFIHFNYHRFLEHVGPNEDFEAGYRAKPAMQKQQKMDPLLLLQKELKGMKLSAEMELIEKQVKGKIHKSVEKAKAAPFPDASELYTDVWA